MKKSHVFIRYLQKILRMGYFYAIIFMEPNTITAKGSDTMLSASAEHRLYTIDDIYDLPEDSKAMDYYTKLSLYREAGVREYWIVDPIKQTILVYDMEQAAAPAVYSFADTIKAGIYDNLDYAYSLHAYYVI